MKKHFYSRQIKYNPKTKRRVGSWKYLGYGESAEELMEKKGHTEVKRIPRRTFDDWAKGKF